MQLERAEVDHAPRRARDAGEDHRGDIVGLVQVRTTSAPISQPRRGRIVPSSCRHRHTDRHRGRGGLHRTGRPAARRRWRRRRRRHDRADARAAARSSRPTTPWNQDVSTPPRRAPTRANYVASINVVGHTKLHPDFGGDGAYGIPFLVVPGHRAEARRSTTPRTATRAIPGRSRSRRPRRSKGAATRTATVTSLVVQQRSCHLYELGRAFWQGDHWDATVGVNWDLRSNALRPFEWTSADAAGLPILPGLVRYDEVAAGHIDHALRFTVSQHADAGTSSPRRTTRRRSPTRTLPPMGLRLRLKASFDTRRASPASRS